MLRKRASELLRRVAAGETIEVTDRGRPVSVLAPPPQGSPVQRLRASGELLPSSGSIDDLPEPVRLEPGQELASEVLARLRRDER